MRKTIIIFASAVVFLFLGAPSLQSRHIYDTEQDIKRWEVAVAIIEAKNLDPSSRKYKKCFRDVRRQHFADEVCYAVSRGWIFAPGKIFRPNDVATPTFAQNAVWNAFGNKYPGNFNDTFSGRISRNRVAVWLDEVIRLRAPVASTSILRTVPRVPEGYLPPY